MSDPSLPSIGRVISFICDSRARAHPYVRSTDFFADGRLGERVRGWLWDMRSLRDTPDGLDTADVEEQVMRTGEWFAFDSAFESSVGVRMPYRAARARLQPLVDGLHLLRELGFRRLYLLGIGPRSPEERPGWKPVGLRLRTRRIFDEVFAEIRRLTGYQDCSHFSTAIVPLVVGEVLGA